MKKHTELVPVPNHQASPEVSKPRGLPKPYLLTRMFVALVDFLLVVALFAGFEVALYQTAFNWFGYHERINEIHQLMEDSHLFIEDGDQGYLTLTEAYTADSDIEDHYDEPIIYFYMHDERALAGSRLDAYYQDKLDSGHFEMGEGTNPIVLSSVSDEDLLDFYETAYESALELFSSNPVYVSDVRVTFYTVVFTSLFSLTLAAGIIYLLVPLVSKKGATPVQWLFKLCLVDARDHTRVKKHQVVLRFLVLLFFNLWIPILLYVEFSHFTLIPNFITLIMMSVTPSFGGPHDFASKTYVVAYKNIDIPEKALPLVVDEGVK